MRLSIEAAALSAMLALSLLALPGAAASAQGVEQASRFHAALRDGNVKEVQALLDAGINVNSVDERRQTPLMLASRYGFGELVSLFLARGADVHARDENEYTALLYAAYAGQAQIVDQLIKAGAKITDRTRGGETALFLGPDDNSTVVKHLLAAGADVNAANGEGDTPLMRAARRMASPARDSDAEEKIVRLLLKQGARVDARNEKGEDAFLQVIGSPKTMDLLLAAGADINSQNNRGQTALMIAADGNYGEEAEFLLRKGADMHRQDRFGRTALWYAKNGMNGSTTIARVLQKKGAKPGLEEPYQQSFPCAKLPTPEARHDLKIGGDPVQLLLVQDPQLEGYIGQAGTCRPVLLSSYGVGSDLSGRVEYQKRSGSPYPAIVIRFRGDSYKAPSITFIWAGDRYEQEGLRESRDLNQKALGLYRQGALREALALWEKAYALAPSPYSGVTANAEVINNLAFAYHQLAKSGGPDGSYDKAEQLYKETQRADQRRWEAYLNLGDLYAERGLAKDAIDNYRMLLHHNPSYRHAKRIQSRIEKLALEASKGSLLTTQKGLAIGKGAPTFTIELFGDRKYGSLTRLLIYRDDTGKQVQAIEIANLEVAEEPTGIEFEDINFDGFQDIKIRVAAGATGNEMFSYALYEPLLRKFNVRHEYEGLDRPRLVPAKRQFILYRNMGGAGSEFAEETYEVRNNIPVLVRTVRQEYLLDKGYLLRTESELKGGKMQVVRETKAPEGW